MIQVRPASPAEPRIKLLIDELDEYQRRLYPDESNHLDSIDELTRENVYFVAAYDHDIAIGCGALKYIDLSEEVMVPQSAPSQGKESLRGGYGEVKRVYVQNESRGKGVSKAIMDALESHARMQDVGVIRLETGIYQPEAIGLYTKLGYTQTGAFGAYSSEDPYSVFMEKILVPK